MKAIRYVGEKSCKEQSYIEGIKDPAVTVINTHSGTGNVTLRFEMDGRPLEVSLDKTRRDFLDLATSIYILDEMVLREDSPDGWTRSFEVVFPVREVERWEAVSALLKDMMWTLSGDSFDFSWLPSGPVPTMSAHRLGLSRGYDAVCLFSGGVDSLLGAHKLLSEGKRVLLVGHQADGTAAAAQTALAIELSKLFPPKDRAPRLRLIQCRTARSMGHNQRFLLPDKCEETHRPRSLLFLAIAVAVSGVTHVKDIYIPENGLIALNPLLQKSRMGTLSTRTAHPLFLTKFADLVKELGLFDGAIRNPFLYLSKTDMLAPQGFDNRLKPLLVRSVSCARPSKYKDKGVRHCGYCVPCVYRRISMMELGLDQNDDYAFDVFSDLPTMSALTQLDFRALVSFAKKTLSASSSQRDLMLLSHGAFSPEAGERIGPHPTKDYRIWSDMLQRWAADFLKKVQQHSSLSTRKIVAI